MRFARPPDGGRESLSIRLDYAMTVASFVPRRSKAGRLATGL